MHVLTTNVEYGTPEIAYIIQRETSSPQGTTPKALERPERPSDEPEQQAGEKISILRPDAMVWEKIQPLEAWCTIRAKIGPI